jgi:hypothetical protein
MQVLLIAGSRRGNKLITTKKYIGCAIDYYPDEKSKYMATYRKNIIGDFDTIDKALAEVDRVIGGLS